MRFFKGIMGMGVVLSLFSCVNKEQPKVIYEPDSVVVVDAKDTKKDDVSQIKIADLPILMEGTKYLIYPVGDIRVYNVSSKYGTSKINQFSYTISNYNRFELTGYLQNLMFQHVDSTSIRPLSDLNIQIETVTFLNTIAEKIKKQILVYSVYDQDTNSDGKIDSSDIKSLYMSKIDGTGFKKITYNLQELIDWNVIDEQNKLYFRTIEDNDKNGAFDKNDNVNYFFVNLSDDEWKVESYELFIND